MDALRVLALLALIGVSSSQTPDCSYLSLLKHLHLTPANDTLQIMRPVKNWTTSTYVGLDMVMYGILHMDEKSQTLTSHIWVQMSWVNEFLTWKPSDFCGIDTLSIPRSRLWLPDVAIQEDASDTGSIYHGPFLTLMPNGFVMSSSRQRLTSTCQLNLALFPFDTQICQVTFGSMTTDESNIMLGTLNNDSTLYKVSEELMVTQGEWELDNMEIEKKSFGKSSESVSRLIYMITMSRKPMLYVINFIVPLFYLLILDVASFFISEARGEKLGFKVTILLSISVLLLILQDMLPSTESAMPYIASYCVGVFALVGISVLEAMLVSFLFDLDGYCSTMVRCSAEAQEEIELEDRFSKEPPGAEEDVQVKQEKSSLPLDGPNSCDVLKQIHEQVKSARQEAKRQKEEEKKPGRYRRMAEIIDHVFFMLYLTAVVGFLTYMYFKWMSNIYP
uniref:5-hydroxytryptamine receptor 3A n=1 Tax=Semicossyphus pulcher TaxID=241346 RepID=UPI0037E8B82E